MKRIIGMLMAVCICFGMCMQTNVSEAARGEHSVDYFKGDGAIENPMWNPFHSFKYKDYSRTDCIDLNSISHINGVYGVWVSSRIVYRDEEIFTKTRREFKKSSNGDLLTRVRWESSNEELYNGTYEPTKWEKVPMHSPYKDEQKESERRNNLKIWLTMFVECGKAGHV